MFKKKKKKTQQPTVARIHFKVRKSARQKKKKNLSEKCDDRSTPRVASPPQLP